MEPHPSATTSETVETCGRRSGGHLGRMKQTAKRWHEQIPPHLCKPPPLKSWPGPEILRLLGTCQPRPVPHKTVNNPQNDSRAQALIDFLKGGP